MDKALYIGCIMALNGKWKIHWNMALNGKGKGDDERSWLYMHGNVNKGDDIQGRRIQC